MAKTRALGYVRVSTTEQVAGFGLDVQEEAIRAFCKANDLRLVDVLRDEGLSGSNGLDTRVALAEALARLTAGEAQVLVVYRIDRLARDLILQETLVQRLREQGTPVRSASEPDLDLDTDDPTKVLIRQIVGAVSQYERAVIRGRMMAGRAAKARAGGYVGGRPSFGYRAVDGRLVPDDGEQQVIALARRLRDEGRSLREIGTELERAGMAPKGNRRKGQEGGRWHPVTVARVLGGSEGE